MRQKDLTLVSIPQHTHTVKYLNLTSLSDLLPDLKRKSKRELAGPCPFCGGEDRFLVFDDRRYWCRVCEKRGDAIQLLRDRDGLSFRDACARLGVLVANPAQRQRASVHSLALARAKRAYRNWKRQQLNALTDEHRLLLAEKVGAEAAYRAMSRYPSLSSEEEQRFWVSRLARIYDRFVVLEHELDALTYFANEAQAFALYQEEVGR